MRGWSSHPEPARTRLMYERSACFSAIIALAIVVAGPGCTRPSSAVADSRRSIDVAVSASASRAVRDLGRVYRDRTGHEVRVSVGSTGALFAQIQRGAPFDVWVAADTVRPARLAADGALAPVGWGRWGTGRLVLFAPTQLNVANPAELGVWDDTGQRLLHVLRALSASGALVARANPRTAPYGAAATQVLEQLGLEGFAGPTAESVGQAYQMVRSAAAEAAFVARAQMIDEPDHHFIVVPTTLHPGLPHGLVLLKRGYDKPHAVEFHEFLLSAEAADIWRRHGFDPVQTP